MTKIIFKEEIDTSIKICDCIMGGGKTSSAINMMNAHPEERFLFVTPYLSEIQRIKSACPGLRFKEPESWYGHPKRDDLEELLARGENVASTHALFAYYSEKTLELIRRGGYTLVLDEVVNVIEAETIKPSDVKMLFDMKFMEMDEDGQHVKWLYDDYDGTAFADIMRKAKLGNLIFYQNFLLFWTLPVASFKAFKEVYVLTYLFHAQMQKYYYEINHVDFEYIGTRRTENGFEFTDKPEIPPETKNLINLVHVYEDDKMNEIGKCPERRGREDNPLTDYALSSQWYKKHPPSSSSKKNAAVLAKNMYNIFRNRWDCRSSDVIWTTFKAYYDYFSKRGFKKSFVPCSIRATNEYRDRHYLAYMINVFFDPRLKNYLTANGAHIDEDAYALSEMVQWIWRSAIRCGEEIWIYVPSRRMRTLLKNWLQELAAPAQE